MGLDENDLLLVDLVDNPGLPEGENCYFQQYDGEYISSNVSKCQIHLQFNNTFLFQDEHCDKAHDPSAEKGVYFACRKDSTCGKLSGFLTEFQNTNTVFIETIPQCIQHPTEESTCLIDFGPGTRQSLVEECDKVKGTLPRPITAEQTSAFAQIHPAQFWTGLTTDEV